MSKPVWIFSGAPWEKKVGYCRAIKKENHIFVSGTTSIDENGNIFALGDPYNQAKRCLEIIQKALRQLNAELKDVVRTRMFVTDITLWPEFGRAHQEYFGDHPPATTMVEVAKLINPEMLIEIEVDAICK